ncbi:MAG: STAS domain-containing protein [Brevundimonas sp.]|jgi:anti-anti-sigma regulatory factor|uniref:STAS domain-containing protein n=1 Tax=Brevundimonas sp. TaxID=1871086 RepID=UPI0017DAD933|nr:STAS domain-containing protein [Brevundimonas sp.]MBA4803341.1 STAS domain-containing protein [Brevundimonas sp.]
MQGRYPLPARLEGPALQQVRTDLLSLRGGDLDLDGAGVQRINGLGLQLLMSAIRTWSHDGRSLRIVEATPELGAALAFAATPITGDLS